jgi:hypothetical protein
MRKPQRCAAPTFEQSPADRPALGHREMSHLTLFYDPDAESNGAWIVCNASDTVPVGPRGDGDV